MNGSCIMLARTRRPAETLAQHRSGEIQRDHLACAASANRPRITASAAREIECAPARHVRPLLEHCFLLGPHQRVVRHGRIARGPSLVGIARWQDAVHGQDRWSRSCQSHAPITSRLVAPARELNPETSSGSRHRRANAGDAFRSPSFPNGSTQRRHGFAVQHLLEIVRRTIACGAPAMKKHGFTRPVASITAENSGALQRSGGNAPSPQSAR